MRGTGVPRLDGSLFTVAQRTYGRRDTIVAAILRGELEAVVDQARRGLACVQRLRLRGKPPAGFDLEQAAQEFRYGHNLISADETAAWLADSGLTFEEWMGYLERSRLRATWADETDGVVARYDVADDELRRVFHSEAICSGEMRRWAEALAGRAAVYARAGTAPGDDPECLDEVLLGRVRRECAFSLESAESCGTTSLEWRARIGDIARIEAGFQECRRAALTPEALQAQILAHRLDWSRVRWRYLVLRDEQTAREAALCVRHENEALEDVAVRAGIALREEEPLLESVDDAIRAATISACAGDLLGPWPSADGFRLAVLLRKSQPSSSDAVVRRRAEEQVAVELVAEGLKDVVWHARI